MPLGKAALANVKGLLGLEWEEQRHQQDIDKLTQPMVVH